MQRAKGDKEGTGCKLEVILGGEIKGLRKEGAKVIVTLLRSD